jgi:excisionase family DNA binding protein
MIGDSEQITYRKRHAAQFLDYGQTKLDAEIASGRIAAVRSGKLILITRAELLRYVRSLPPAAVKAHSNNTSERRQAARASESA